MSELQFEVRDDVALVTFNRPECLNAFRRETYAEFRDCVARLDVEEAVRAAVFTGAGRAFCAGQDLKEAGNGAVTREQLYRALEDIQGITRGIAGLRKPTVCAINGPAVGFGLELTLACDVRLASADAHFALPELEKGLFQTNGTYHYLPLLVGASLAADMILTGRRLSAEVALQTGLVSRLVPAESLVQTAISLARQIGRLESRALQLARAGLRDGRLRTDLDAALAFEEAACLELLLPA